MWSGSLSYVHCWSSPFLSSCHAEPSWYDQSGTLKQEPGSRGHDSLSLRPFFVISVLFSSHWPATVDLILPLWVAQLEKLSFHVFSLIIYSAYPSPFLFWAWTAVFMSWLYNCTNFFLVFLLVWFLRDTPPAVMFRVSDRLKKLQSANRNAAPNTGGFCFFCFWRQVTDTDASSLQKVSPPAFTLKEFDIHLYKVAAQREAEIASFRKKRLINRMRSWEWSLFRSRSWLGWKEL